MNFLEKDVPNHKYVILKYKDEIIIDHKLHRYCTLISGIVKVKKNDMHNNYLNIMIMKLSDTVKLKSTNNYYYVLEALTDSKILGS